MATYYARKSGNIDATDVWATTPSGTAGAQTFASGDVLVANSFTVTVNVTTNLGSTGEVRNDTTGGATAGGSFAMSTTGVTLTAKVIAGAVTCVATSGSVSVTVVGDVTGGTASAAYGINHNSSGTLNIVGAVTGGIAGNCWGLHNASGLAVITGNVSGGSGPSAHGVLSNSASSATTITGNVTGGTQGDGFRHAGSYTASITGTVSGGVGAGATAQGGGIAVSGTCVGAASGAAGLFTGSFVCSATRAKGGPNTGSPVGVAAGSASATTVEEIEYGDLGASPTSGPIRLSDKTSNVAVMYRFGTTKKTLVDTASTSLLPAASNVRSGTVYNAGQTTGTCAVPGAASVLVGVPVDNTVGTASVSSAAIQSACDAALTAFSSGRLANCATVASTGQALADALTPS